MTRVRGDDISKNIRRSRPASEKLIEIWSQKTEERRLAKRQRDGHQLFSFQDWTDEIESQNSEKRNEGARQNRRPEKILQCDRARRLKIDPIKSGGNKNICECNRQKMPEQVAPQKNILYVFQKIVKKSLHGDIISQARVGL